MPAKKTTKKVAKTAATKTAKKATTKTAKKAAKKVAKPAPKTAASPAPSHAQLEEAAFYIYLRRCEQGLPGTPDDDWAAAVAQFAA